MGQTRHRVRQVESLVHNEPMKMLKSERHLPQVSTLMTPEHLNCITVTLMISLLPTVLQHGTIDCLNRALGSQTS
jgi:hypothetical protein